MKKEELYTLQLIDGLKSNVGGKDVFYKTVRLRETSVADELAAVELAERLVTIKGKPTLILSDEVYRVAMTMRHIEKFMASGLDDIGQDVLTLNMMGRLSLYDMQRIEERCMLIGLAAQLRYGLVTQADFDQVLAGESKPDPTGPRSTGQAEGLGNPDAENQSGPQMLADHSANRP